ncbi:hypothetical protein PZA11_004413 [Diplocarpon coronariae]
MEKRRSAGGWRRSVSNLRAAGSLFLMQGQPPISSQNVRPLLHSKSDLSRGTPLRLSQPSCQLREVTASSDVYGSSAFGNVSVVGKLPTPLVERRISMTRAFGDVVEYRGDYQDHIRQTPVPLHTRTIAQCL